MRRVSWTDPRERPYSPDLQCRDRSHDTRLKSGRRTRHPSQRALDPLATGTPSNGTQPHFAQPNRASTRFKKLTTVGSCEMSISEKSIFEVSNLRVVRNGNEILKSISFRAVPGELIGLLGPSGSGKSTLMRSLLGVQAITGGSARIMESVAGSPSLRGRLGYMAQTSAVYLDLTVEENIRYFAGVLAEPLSEVARVMDVVALASFSHRLVSSLSGGERTRVSLGVALLGSPPALILDEPTVGLDPILRRDLWRTFDGLAKTGVTVIVSSHVMDEAARCARLLLLRDGTLLFDGTPASLLAASQAPRYDEAFERLIEGDQ